MGIRKLFKTDKKVEKEGLWLDYGDGEKIKIARAGGANKKFAKKLAQLARPHRRAIQTEAIDEEIALGLLRQTYAESVVLDWEGIKHPVTGDPNFPFTVENCVLLFKEVPDLFQDVQEQANRIALFREMVLEEDSGNL